MSAVVLVVVAVVVLLLLIWRDPANLRGDRR